MLECEVSDKLAPRRQCFSMICDAERTVQGAMVHESQWAALIMRLRESTQPQVAARVPIVPVIAGIS